MHPYPSLPRYLSTGLQVNHIQAFYFSSKFFHIIFAQKSSYNSYQQTYTHYPQAKSQGK